MKIPEHPADVIKREYIDANHLPLRVLKEETGIQLTRFQQVFKHKEYFTVPEAVCLARFFGEPDDHFVVLQGRHFAAWVARRDQKQLGKVRNLEKVKAENIRRRKNKTVETKDKGKYAVIITKPISDS